MPGDALQSQLLQILEENDSLYPLMAEFPRMASALAQAAGVWSNQGGARRTVAALRAETPGSKWTMTTLLYSMHPSSVKAIVRNTVAVDSSGPLHGRARWQETPSDPTVPVQGVYVVGLRRTGKISAEFLTPTEMRRIAHAIQSYLGGFAAYNKPAAQRTQQEKLDLAYRDRVDSALSSAGGGGTLIHSQTAVSNATRLRQSLIERADMTLALDPTGTIRHRQSPLYVGCSNNLRARMSCYSGPRYTNASQQLAFLLAVAQAERLTLQPVAKVALRTWSPDQLHTAEQLVMTLAGSLLWQHGLNLEEGGGNRANTGADFAKMERHVFANSALSANLDKANIEAERRAELLETYDRVCAKLADSQAQLTAATRDMPVLRTSAKEVLAEGGRQLAARRRELERALERKRLWNIVLRIVVAGDPEAARRVRDGLDEHMRAAMDNIVGPLLDVPEAPAGGDMDLD